MPPLLFSALNLSPELLKAVAKLGFEQASPIQAESIPLLLAGRDIVGQSQTGSGKTAAFAIPAIEKTDPHKREPQVLILCPTRELAVQVSEEVHKLALFKRGIHALPIYGGQSYERQFWGLRQGAQIIIGTPGRVMDHMRRGTLRLDTVKIAILDEADVMLNMGFREDIETILQSVPTERQTVFFSATMPKPIRDLIEKYSRAPASVNIEQKAVTVATVEQVYYEIDRRFKAELLTRLVDIHDFKLGIVFCNTKRMVDELADHLGAAGYSADRLHGDMSQVQRDRVMNKFRKSGLEFLVATDVAARGIDVDDVEVVFNYDLPYDPEDYVHRIGRTGRAGRSGIAISFVAGREIFQVRNIERFTRQRIQRGRVPTVAEVEEARENVFLDRVRGLLQGGEFKRQDSLIERLLEEGHTSTDIASALFHLLQAGDVPPASPAPPAPPAREERYDRPFRPERAPYPERAPHLDRRLPARPERPPREPEFEPRPPRPVSERGIPPKRVASRPAVQIAPPDPPSVPAPGPAIQPGEPPAAPATETATPKPTRKTPAGQTRLYMNVGAEADVVPIDIVNAIAGETGLPGKVVGKVDVRERHLFVDVATDHVEVILARLNRAEIKGHKVKTKVA